ncbi:MAG: hypothetical protein RMJ17_02350 [Candidatus Aenigmarchaeota archaeon]|nr:hypothetical protein [Candidatus Aenigmarchaeota archaeon]MDW8149413.1 hypothetical protein [Candidatus Aenigmarchaeota archaeon]
MEYKESLQEKICIPKEIIEKFINENRDRILKQLGNKSQLYVLLFATQSRDKFTYQYDYSLYDAKSDEYALMYLLEKYRIDPDKNRIGLARIEKRGENDFDYKLILYK